MAPCPWGPSWRALRLREGQLDPELVLSLIELALPTAAESEAVELVAHLSGHEAASVREQVAEVSRRRERQRREVLLAEKKAGRLNAKVQSLIERVDWPRDLIAVSRKPLRPLRVPRGMGGRGISGFWDSARLGRSVGYDSKAELAFIQLIDMSDLVRSYCEQPDRIDYELFGELHSYYPDLAVDLHDGRRLLIEVKARAVEFAKHENVVKFAAARAYCHARGWGFIATDGGRTPDDLLNRKVAPEAEQLLRDHLKNGPVNWASLKSLIRENGISLTDVAALIYRNGWYWQTDPFWLSIILPDSRWDAGGPFSSRRRKPNV